MDVVLRCMQVISKERSADVAIFSSEINSKVADRFIDMMRENLDRQENLVFLLTTSGGEPDAAYRIVKSIKRHYKKFILYVFGSCKSAGTLMALGADEIVMTELGELGPLDIQLMKDDELVNTSGLSYLQTLYSLNSNLIDFFEMHFLQLKRRSGNTITTKTAAHISHELVTGLIAPISGQIDPIKLGEVQRAVRIAESYGYRLCNNKTLIHKLITEYPSHSFVIDKDEAHEIFGSSVMGEVTDSVIALENALKPLKVTRYESDPGVIEIFDKKALHSTAEAETENSTTPKNESNENSAISGQQIQRSEPAQVNGTGQHD